MAREGWPIIIELNGSASAHWGLLVLGRTSLSCVGLPVQDRMISVLHAGLWPEGSDWYVHDCGSANGTWLDGVRVWSDTRVRKGSSLRIGRTVLRLVPAG